MIKGNPLGGSHKSMYWKYAQALLQEILITWSEAEGECKGNFYYSLQTLETISVPRVLNWMPVLQAKVLRQENKPLLFDTLNMYSLIYINFNLVFILYWSVVWLQCCIENQTLLQ